jgi:hypothetical protein
VLDPLPGQRVGFPTCHTTFLTELFNPASIYLTYGPGVTSGDILLFWRRGRQGDLKIALGIMPWMPLTPSTFWVTSKSMAMLARA